MRRTIEQMAAEAKRTRDVVDVRTPILEPTPEQRHHARYVKQDIVDTKPGGKSITIGKAYRRQAKFEQIKGNCSRGRQLVG